MSDLSSVIEDVNADPRRRISFYEYPQLYDFFQSRVLDRDAQVRTLERFRPEDTTRVLELGCGTGPLLARIEDDYEEVVGADVNENMLRVAEERLTSAEVVRADFTDWSAAADDRTFDVAVLMGGLLHVTDDDELDALAENTYRSLRTGGTFATFFAPFTDDVENGSEDVKIAESERYRVERRSISALTSSDSHYTTTYLFVVTDRERTNEARIGTVFQGRFHDPKTVQDAFSNAGFGRIETIDRDGSILFHARK